MNVEEQLADLQKQWDDIRKEVSQSCKIEIINKYVRRVVNKNINNKYDSEMFLYDESYRQKVTESVMKKASENTKEMLKEKLRDLKVERFSEKILYFNEIVKAINEQKLGYEVSVSYDFKFNPTFRVKHIDVEEEKPQDIEKKAEDLLTSEQQARKNANELAVKIASDIITQGSKEASDVALKTAEQIEKERKKHEIIANGPMGKIITYQTATASGKKKANEIYNIKDMEYKIKEYETKIDKTDLQKFEYRYKPNGTNRQMIRRLLKETKIKKDDKELEIKQKAIIRAKDILQDIRSVTDLPRYITNFGYIGTLDLENIEDLGWLSDSEYEGFKSLKNKIGKDVYNKLEKFRKTYTDENGKKYFDTRLMVVKPQIKNGTFQKGKWVLDDIESDFKTEATLDNTKDIAKLLEDELQDLSGYQSKGQDRAIIDNYLKLIDKRGKDNRAKDNSNLDYADIDLRYFKLNRNGNVKTAKDKEVNYVFDILLKALHGNLDILFDYYKKLPEKYLNERIERTKQELDLLKTGKYIQTAEDGKPVIREPRNDEERKIAKGWYIKLNPNAVLTNSDTLSTRLGTFDDMFKFKTLKSAVKENKKIADAYYEKYKQKIYAQTKVQVKANFPILSLEKIENRVSGNFNKEISKLEKNARTRKNTKDKSAMEIRGMENMFISDITFEYPADEYHTRKEMRNQIRQSPWQNATNTWSINFGFSKPVRVVRRSSLKPIPIPASYLKSQILKDNYGDSRAATFFQLLVSNTPVDEKYHYKEKRKYLVKGKADLTERDEDLKVEFERDAEDIALDMIEGSKLKTMMINRVHIPDKERIRDFWEFTYKGVKFTPVDPEFQTGEDLFDIRGDIKSIAKIKNIIMERTAKSKTKNINFTYKNTNPRWEQLEYGGYKTQNTGPWRGEDKYKRQHGITNGFTYQAPNGWLRLIEAQWNQLIDTGKVYSIEFETMNYAGFNAEKIAKDVLEDLKEFESTLGTHEYDYHNFTIIEGE